MDQEKLQAALRHCHNAANSLREAEAILYRLAEESRQKGEDEAARIGAECCLREVRKALKHVH